MVHHSWFRLWLADGLEPSLQEVVLNGTVQVLEAPSFTPRDQCCYDRDRAKLLLKSYTSITSIGRDRLKLANPVTVRVFTSVPAFRIYVFDNCVYVAIAAYASLEFVKQIYMQISAWQPYGNTLRFVV